MVHPLHLSLCGCDVWPKEGRGVESGERVERSERSERSERAERVEKTASFTSSSFSINERRRPDEIFKPQEIAVDQLFNLTFVSFHSPSHSSSQCAIHHHHRLIII